MAPFFNSSTPFDKDVETATDENNLTENWSNILDICEKVQSTENGSRDCLRSIVKRLHHKVPFVCLQALTLLDSCVQNCGKNFHIEVADKDFISTCRVLIKTKAHPKVAKVLKDLIEKWALNEFKNDLSLSTIPAYYESLKNDGYFPASSAKSNNITPINNKTPSSSMNAELKKEQDDLDKAIALSLAEENKSVKIIETQSNFHQGTSQKKEFIPKETKMVRALFDFEAVEDNELTFKTGELICIIDDSDVNWWKGSNSGGEGLFPANFVTTDIKKDITSNEEKCIKKDNKIVSFKDSAKPTEIDEELIDNALNAIQNIDPSCIIPDSDEMMFNENQSINMQPIIDVELQQIDRKYNDLMELNGKVLNALHMYSTLMKDTPVYTPFKPQDMQYNMQAYLNNYAPVDTQYNSENNQVLHSTTQNQNNIQPYNSDEQNLNLDPNNQNNSNNVHDYSNMTSALPNNYQTPY